MKKTIFILFFFMLLGFTGKAQVVFTNQLVGTGLERPDKIGIIKELFDYNNDGYEDIIYYTQSSMASLFKNNGNGTFINVSSSANFPILKTDGTLICADLDNNGYRDVIYYLNHGGANVNDTLRIFMNYNGSFVEKTTEFGIVNPIKNGVNHWNSSIVPLDYDKDGDLDLIFASTTMNGTSSCNNSKVSVLVNKLNDKVSSTFNTIVDLLSFPTNTLAASIAVTDYNNDQLGDIVVCEQNGGEYGGYRADPFNIYKNNGNATFSKVAGTNLADGALHNFITVWDYNNDGNLDFINGTSDCCGTRLNIIWKNNGNGTYTDMRSTFNLHPVSDYYGRLSAVDANNDGYQDISTTGLGGFWSDTRHQLWENSGTIFSNKASNYGIQVGYNGGFKGISSTSEWFDYDNDGDLDLYSFNANDGPNNTQALMNNPNSTSNKYLRIKLVGTESPRDGIGSRVVLKMGSQKLTQYNNGTIGNNLSTIFHFGLGQATTVDSLFVYWSSGRVTKLANVAANQVMTITEKTLISTESYSKNWLETFEIPIKTSVLKTDSNYISYQFNVNFDATKLQYSDKSVIGTIAESGTVVVNQTVPGTLAVSYMTSTALQGAGEILKLQFKAIGVGDASLTLSGFLYNNTAIDVKNGTLTLVDITPPTAIISYSNANGNVRFKDNLIITATFSEPMADSPVPQIVLSGANTLTAIDMLKVSSSVYTYTHAVNKGNGVTTVSLLTGKDTHGNVVVSVPTSGAIFNVIPLRYGDIDDNTYIRAYDAAMTLQYSVGLDPLPTVDPLPWELWRVATADIDGSGTITANDASLILQRSVMLITQFPIENAKKSIVANGAADITITVANGKLFFTAKGSLFGLNISADNTNMVLGIPEVLDDHMMIAYNFSDSKGSIGVATAYAPLENTPFLTIPITNPIAKSITFDLIVNTEQETVTVDLTTGFAEFSSRNISIYPNLVKDNLKISGISTPSIATIYSENGRLLQTNKLNNSICDINLTGLSAGMYIIKLQSDNELVVKRFVKL